MIMQQLDFFTATTNKCLVEFGLTMSLPNRANIFVKTRGKQKSGLSAPEDSDGKRASLSEAITWSFLNRFRHSKNWVINKMLKFYVSQIILVEVP